MRALVILLSLLLAAAPLARPDAQAPSPDTTSRATNRTAAEAQDGATDGAAAAETATPAEWTQRVDELEDAIRAGERPRTDADRLFFQLDPVLEAALEEHRGIFGTAQRVRDVVPRSGDDGWADWGKTVADLYAAIETLYDARLRLLQLVTPDTHAELTGSGVAGVRQVSLELAFVERKLRYQHLAIPEGSRHVWGRIQRAPVPALLGTLVVVVTIVVFRGWRRWAKDGLPRLKQLAQRAWRDHAAARPFTSFLRYFERIRPPLEWFTLLYIVFTVFHVPEVRVVYGILRIVAFALLAAWFSVNLADAFATRPRRVASFFFLERTEERDKVRLYSLWIVATWAVVLVAGLRLTNHLAGKGTLHAWTWHLFELLAIPVFVLLLVVWRPVIRKHLEREAHFSAWVEKLLKRRGWLGELAATIGGMAYLLALGARRAALRLARRTPLGGTLVAEALRQSMSRSTADDAELPELDPDLRRSWLRGEGVVESVVADKLKDVIDMIAGGWRTIVLVGERGAGKSFFVKQLAARLEGEVLVVSTPHGDSSQAIAALARALGLEGASPDAATVTAAVRERGVRLIVWDDMHRLCRPILGGQEELDRIADLLEAIEGVTVLSAVDAAAWEYIRRVREGTLPGAATVVLPAWTEDQIGELVELRAREIGMELDYADLSFPRILLDEQFDSPEEGLRASYRRVLWAEADGNPEVALRLVVDALVEKNDGDGVLRLPHTPTANELGTMTLVELLVLRFLVQTDGATVDELVAGLRYPQPIIENVLITSEKRGVIEENHGRYRLSWKWYRTVTRVLNRRNMLGTFRQAERNAAAQRRPGRAPARPASGRRFA